MHLYPVWDIVHDDNYDSLIDALLAGRGLTRQELDVGPETLHPPELLTDLEPGVERIATAIRQKEKIVVFGDYDADGVTSTALLMDFLEKTGAEYDYLLPDRHRDGYGLKPPGVERALEKGAELIITVDNGISAFEALDLARERQVDVVVVDHHRQLDDLPTALAIINPNRKDCGYPFKELAGVGVTFKVVQALSQLFMEGQERRQYLNGLLDLVALGTVADVMPVLGENRVLIQRGLQVFERTARPGLRHLKEVAGYANRTITTTALGFHMGPRLNVAGRLKTADLALRLLRADRDSEAAILADELNRLNAQRQSLQRDGLKEAESLVSQEDLESDRIIVLLGESWHLGIVGLLASRLAEKHARPAVVCTGGRGDGTYTGSARSIPAYDISAGIGACAEHLIAYGGHPGAAGFSLEEGSFESFRIHLVEHANAHISAEDLQARLAIDLMLRPRDIGPQTLKFLDQLEPFGNGHQAPVFGARNCQVKAVRQIGRDSSHLKLELLVGGRRCNAVWWNQGGALDQIPRDQSIDAAFSLQEDTYAGDGSVQLVLKDVRPGENGNSSLGKEEG
jgi:single-stranded-DNA-specific exonuclease